ncbi:MAG: AAA family ATPase [Bryobacterales bacterium]|nr:AAA family ATPase [Bryobacterales bacterium]
MTTISKISRLRNFGVFRDFNWPQHLHEFSQYNLIYGWNGTGKTTISRLFRCLEQGEIPALGEVSLRINDREVRNKEFAVGQYDVRVFNRDFVRENVFATHGEHIDSIVVLGAESVKTQKQISGLKKQVSEARSKLRSTRDEETRAVKSIDQFCIDNARQVKNMLSSSGSNKYNNYNKTHFKNRAMTMVNDGNAASCRLSTRDRTALQNRQVATLKNKINEISYTLPNFEAIVEHVSRLLMTTISSVTINALTHDAELSDWTREGLALHKERSAEQCQFCDQPLSKQRLDELEAHFSETYKKHIALIDRSIKRIAVLKGSTDQHLPNEAQLYDDLSSTYDSAEKEFINMLNIVREFLERSIKLLKSKKNHLFEAVHSDLKTPIVDDEAIHRINSVIQRHNTACDNFGDRVNDARVQLADDIVAENLKSFVHLSEFASNATAKREKKELLVKSLDDRIDELELEILEHRRPAEELNDDLHSYLGHSDLSLETKETGYSLTRGGRVARSLSEGERTAVALLYFLKSLEDRRFNISNGIVVLDDPVSSLDANALFSAFGFIRQRTEIAGQLFLFTHNFSLFKQTRNWFHRVKKRNRKTGQKPAQFFLLESVRVNGIRSSSIQPLDSLLRNYGSEYQYLFSRIYSAATSDEDRGLEGNYFMPNMARRVLEAFLEFHQPHVRGSLWKKLCRLGLSESRNHRIIRFLHTHSHGMGVLDSGHDLTALAEGRTVLRELLRLIEEANKDHYTAMVEVATWQQR